MRNILELIIIIMTAANNQSLKTNKTEHQQAE
jgi:hypothetical protein